MLDSNTSKITWVAVATGVVAVLGAGAMALFPQAMDSGKAAVTKAINNQMTHVSKVENNTNTGTNKPTDVNKPVDGNSPNTGGSLNEGNTSGDGLHKEDHWNELEAKIAENIGNDVPNADILVYDVKNNRTLGHQKGDVTFNYAASIIKVSVLTQLLHNQPNLTDEQKQLASKMIRDSDNDSTTALFNQIGGVDGLNELFRNLGMTHTTAHPRWGLTNTNAADQLILMKQLFISGDYLDAKSKDYVKELMGSVNEGQKWGLPKNTTASTKTYIKNGWLPLGANYSDAIVNSLSYVKSDTAEYILVQISNEDATQNAGFDMLNRVGQVVYDTLK